MSLTKETLHQLYVVEGKTDKEIASIYKVDRTAICKKRAAFNIPSRKNFGEHLNKLIERLEIEGFSVRNLYAQNKLTDVDLIVNDTIRIDVLTSTASVNTPNIYHYALTSRENGCLANDKRIVLDSGRYKKLFHKTCDFLLFIGINGNERTYWLIPSAEIGENTTALGITNSPKSKYEKYRNAFHLLEDFTTSKTFTNDDLTKLQSAQMLLLKAHQEIVNTNGRTALADDLQATYFDVRELVDKLQRGAQ